MRRFLRKQNLNALSLRDVLEARDQYAVHLANMPNVLGTSVGRYRVRVRDKRSPEEISRGGSSRLGPKTLANSVMKEWAWPCVLVLVSDWLEPEEFTAHPEAAVPPILYLADGRIVRTCVILVEPREKNLPSESVFLNTSSVLGSGSQIFTEAQGQLRLGVATCLATDGGLTYVLGSGHLMTPVGSPVRGQKRGRVVDVGVTSKVVTSVPVGDLYPGFPGNRTQVTLDTGLLQVESAHDWTSQVSGVGSMGLPVDLSSETLTLDLIGCPVFTVLPGGHRVEGSVQGLFYRHASVAGVDSVTELLIGPRDGGHVETRPGDSGVLWFWDHLADRKAEEDELPPKARRETEFRPLAIQWGGQGFKSDTDQAVEFALASSLSSVCKYLGVEIVRDWAAFQSRYWGKVGHYKVAGTACQLLQSPKAKRLFKANLVRISVSDSRLESQDLPMQADAATFIPLADVADLYFRNKRKKDEANHFADMDEVSHEAPFKGKTLLELWDLDITSRKPAVWTAFYDSIDPSRLDKHRGALPFRIAELYGVMVQAVKAGEIAKYVCAAGLLAHYAGDACQPLHISHLHHGQEDDPTDDAVHAVYEDKMLTKYAVEVVTGVNSRAFPVKKTELFKGSVNAADAVVKLMGRTVAALSPETVLDCFNQTRGQKQLKKMWGVLGKLTLDRLADGARTLALIWQSAWTEGGGDKAGQIDALKLKAVPESALKRLYENPKFAESRWLKEM